jgi:hypothetical protein
MATSTCDRLKRSRFRLPSRFQYLVLDVRLSVRSAALDGLQMRIRNL